MARLAFLFSLFLLFTLSHARFLTADETSSDLPESNPESTTTTSIFLPSERPDLNNDDASGIGSIPLTRIRFLPVNRHFPRRPLFPFRHKHSCRFHKRFRTLNPRFHHKRFISYGNDMILSDDKSFDPESHGVFVRSTPDGAVFTMMAPSLSTMIKTVRMIITTIIMTMTMRKIIMTMTMRKRTIIITMTMRNRTIIFTIRRERQGKRSTEEAGSRRSFAGSLFIFE
ncbi:uncharacterized protein LOC120172100 [Hibiscus syriacus]|uniref:uncharacterized protein LOC120172100 n=1 Tax=Hibiscus syriacus TaxID=106335 RepID=UPI00192211A6|nr:uncharacterized protein LOC120172100 [Hibiscus syriacus]